MDGIGVVFTGARVRSNGQQLHDVVGQIPDAGLEWWNGGEMVMKWWWNIGGMVVKW